MGKSTMDAAGPLEYDDVSGMGVWKGEVTLELFISAVTWMFRPRLILSQPKGMSSFSSDPYYSSAMEFLYLLECPSRLMLVG